MAIGMRIKGIRKDIGIYQNEFAKRLDVSVPTLSEVENGKIRPGFEILFRLSTRFNVNLEFILHGVGHAYKQSFQSHLTPQAENSFGELSSEWKNILWFIQRSPIYRSILLKRATDTLFEFQSVIKEEVGVSPSVELLKLEIENSSKSTLNQGKENTKEHLQ